MSGKSAPVPDTAVGTDFDLALDVSCHLAAQVTLDLEVGVDEVAQLRDLVLGQVTDAGVRGQPRLLTDQRRGVATDAEYIGERDLEALFPRDVDSGNTSHT